MLLPKKILCTPKRYRLELYNFGLKYTVHELCYTLHKTDSTSMRYTVTKAKHEAGAQNKDDGKFHHPHTVYRSEKSVINIDRDAQSMLLMEFSVTLVFCSCVTHGFFRPFSNRVGRGENIASACPVE
jgi:hypothetical protein